MTHLDSAMASRLAGLALAHVGREYPNKLDHVLNGPEDLAPPSVLHPIFYGSFDWHSNVHGYWLLATLYRQFGGLGEGARIRVLFDAQFTADKVQREVAYLRQPSRGTFERPYGWAWLLMLAAELARHEQPEARAWRDALFPLAREFADRFRDFLPKATYPIRAGTHFNTAFALSLALEFAAMYEDDELAATLRAKARAWYSGDRDCQAWEPGGDDFLSPALMEADCMRRMLQPDEWSRWMDAFLPRVAMREPRSIFLPADVSDRSDGKIAHLDGLNLSRAWNWRCIARSWRSDDPRRALALRVADEHVAASLPHVADDYAGAHWLATYALLAILAGDRLKDW
jgi:Protein of unknown function (DUF2891)